MSVFSLNTAGHFADRNFSWPHRDSDRNSTYLW